MSGTTNDVNAGVATSSPSTADRIRELWATSNQQLAANWQQATPAEDNREQMAEWYRQNSELYLFAISAYNLEYKRIRSNMKVLRLARGATLDYGAGNGEILLELARRGHRAAYYDVEGVTMRFARQRAANQGLAIEFFLPFLSQADICPAFSVELLGLSQNSFCVQPASFESRLKGIRVFSDPLDVVHGKLE